MILVDTSVWISHFRDGNSELAKLLDSGEVLCHPFIIGELACGMIKNRHEILSLLNALPTAASVEHSEVLQFIENYALMGRGLGLIDINLLASALISVCNLWTIDKRLNATAAEFDIDFKPTL